ncbi:MAG: hypothetical protein LAP87_27300 [Acidobacteriia bacterium]|nr:hypothetical protein [Terriglobia bacterium]
MNRFIGACGVALLLLYHYGHAQVIEFESNGLKYQTLTKSGVTVMFARLPARLHEYSIIQVAISNGSAAPYVIRPEDFSYVRGAGAPLNAAPAGTVIAMLVQKGSGSDLIKLVTTYEAGVYGNPHMKSTNGYEQRRQAAIAAGSSRLKAAAIASVLAMTQIKLPPGESTDGAVFFPTEGKPLAGGRLVVRTNTDVFEFKSE